MFRNFFISGQCLKASSLALLLVSSLVCSLLSYPLANAAPGYNDDYQNIDHVETGASNYYSINCDTTNLSTSWSKYITDASTWYNPSDENNTSSWNYQAKASFQTALDHGRWGVSQRSEYGSGGYNKVVTVFWTEDSSLSLSWNLEGVDARSTTDNGNNVHYLSIGCRRVVQGNGGSEPIAWAYGSGAIRVSNDKPYNPAPTNTSEDDGIANLFVYTDHPNYPSGYAGTPIPSSFTPKTDFYVPYILNVDDKNITVTPKPVDTGGKCWRWASTLIKKGSSTSDNLSDWEIISETDYLASNEPGKLKAKVYGDDYAIGMLAYDCTAPAAKISDTYNLKLERIYPLKIDGSSYVMDSDNLNCGGNGGVCTEPSPYEDCSTYGTDLIGGLGCVMRNFGVFLRSLFVTLFVPTPGFLKDFFTDFRDFITTKFGFLVWPLTWAVDFVNAFFNGLNGTNNICGWSFGNVFNRDFKLNFCSLEQNFPTAFNTARYMIQAFTVFVLISGLYTHYRRTIKT